MWVRFDPQVGREQAGRRPAIVVGSGLAAQVALRNRLVIVVPCTSTDRGLPWQPSIMLGGQPGVAMCDQVKAISVDRVDGPYVGGGLTQVEIRRIQAALRQMLAL